MQKKEKTENRCLANRVAQDKNNMPVRAYAAVRAVVTFPDKK